MQISDDNLIAYLLGDASADVVREIRRQLAVEHNPLRKRINELRAVLGQIDSVSGIYEPPGDLVDSTLARIDASQMDASQMDASQMDASQTEHQSKPQGRFSGGATTSLSPTSSAGVGRRVWDSAVLTLSLSLICCLVLPAIVRARFDSRKAQCANSLRVTGVGLMQYALSDPQQRFPYVRSKGRNGFAGIYAVRLQSAGIPIHPDQLQCSSLNGCTSMVPVLVLQSIPTLAELEEVPSEELLDWQRTIGGDYAYNLGVVEGRTVVAPRYEGRNHFAILADSPVFINDREMFIAHDGRGINILYENGRVAFVSIPKIMPVNTTIDYPFRNDLGEHAFGITQRDSSLAPSHYSPLGHSAAVR